MSAFIKFLDNISENHLEALARDRIVHRGHSPLLLKLIHAYQAFWVVHESNCTKSSRSCFDQFLKEYIDRSNYRVALEPIKEVLRALTLPNLDMTAQAFTRVNNIVKDIFGEDTPEHKFSRATMRLEPEEIKIRIRKANTKRYEKNLTAKVVEDTSVYQAITNGLVSENWEDKMIGLALATGCRLIELLAVSDINRTDKAYEIEVTGVAKDEKGYKRRKAHKTIIKPTISMTGNQVVKQLKDLRGEVYAKYPTIARLAKGKSTELDNRRIIANLINTKLNTRVHFLFGPDISFHTLRAIYGNFSFGLFNPKCSLPAWLSQVLGHEPGSLGTSLSYSTVTIKKKQ